MGRGVSSGIRPSAEISVWSWGNGPPAGREGKPIRFSCRTCDNKLWYPAERMEDSLGKCGFTGMAWLTPLSFSCDSLEVLPMKEDNDRLESSGFSRRDFLKVAGTAGLLAGVGMPLVAGAAESQGTPKHGGRLRVSVPPIKSLDPVKMDTSGAIAIVQQSAEYLVWAGPDLKLRPVLAEKWQASNGGKTWVFKLREGVKFHDGREMTADDVVATFQRLVNPKSASAAASQIPFLKPGNVGKVDRYTVRFDLDRAVGAFPYYTQTYNAVILPADYKGDFAAHPVGTGPFLMTDYKAEESATFQRNPHYWGKGAPYLDGVDVSVYGSSQPQVLGLQGGTLDVMLLCGYPDAKPLLGDSKVKIVAAHSAEHRELTMRVDRKPFDDKRVRLAVALCLNRPAIVHSLLGGKADIGNDHPIAPVYPVHLTVPQRRENLQRARKLLAEAGYPHGFDIDLYTEQYAEVPQYAVLIQQMLAAANIRVKLHIQPQNLYYNHWTEVTFGLTDWTSRPTPGQILASAFMSDSKWNAPHWKNKQFDKLVEQLQAETDAHHRSVLANRIATILHDDVPAVIAYFIQNLRPMRTHVRGVDGNMSNYLDLTRAWVD